MRHVIFDLSCYIKEKENRLNVKSKLMSVNK